MHAVFVHSVFVGVRGWSQGGVVAPGGVWLEAAGGWSDYSWRRGVLLLEQCRGQRVGAVCGSVLSVCGVSGCGEGPDAAGEESGGERFPLVTGGRSPFRPWLEW